MNPIHPHCGPFNRVSKRKSKDPVDELCRLHDIGYGRIGKRAYFYNNKYDKEFIAEMGKQPGLLPKLYKRVFDIKHYIMPNLPEDMVLDGPVLGKRGIEYDEFLLPKKKMAKKGKNAKVIVAKKKAIRGKRKYVAKKGRYAKKNKAMGKRRYKRKRTIRKNDWAHMGCVEKVERGSQIATNDLRGTAYVGHSFVPDRVKKHMLMAVIKRLFMKAGIDIQNFSNPIAHDLYNNGAIGTDFKEILVRFNYRLGGDLATAVQHVEDIIDGTVNATSKTYEDMVDGLLAEFSLLITTEVIEKGITFLNVTLRVVQSELNAHVPLASLNLKNIDLVYSLYSDMVIQNVTTSHVGDSYSMDNIQSNPIVAMAYYSKKNTNGFELQGIDWGASAPRMYTEDDNPIFFKQVNVGDVNYDVLGKLPGAKTVGALSAKKFVLPPGQFMKQKVSVKGRMPFNKMFDLLQPYFTLSDIQMQKRDMKFGKAQMFGFEAILNNRNEGTVGLRVNYEVNQVYRFKVVEKRGAGTVAMVDVA